MPLDLQGINLAEFPLFHHANEEIAHAFLNRGFLFRYEAGTSLVSNNDLGETFFQILRGMAKLVLVDVQGKDANVTLFRDGDFFGELSMLEPMPLRSAHVIALTEIEVVAIQKKDFLRAMHEHPVLALNLARVLGQRLRSMNDRMATDHLPDDMHKVAHTFLMLAKKGRMFDDHQTILLPALSYKEWIMFCHTTSEGFMESMEKLKELGVVEWQNQRIAITNIEGLHRCAVVHEQRMHGETGIP
jgi:CRP/FNR family cyclic AMP-dependent transcriptional regulator